MNIKVIENQPVSEVLQMLERPLTDTKVTEKAVNEIFDAVKRQGDKAVREYTLKFDKAALQALTVSSEEIADAAAAVSDELKNAIQCAIQNVELFHTSQLCEEKTIGTMPGVYCWQRSLPIERVGIYIPGGSAPLFSTVIMLAVPARVAGCSEVVLCTPPRPDGTIDPAILYTASVTGVTTIVRAGGIQAIAAMAFGTETVPRVDKIFGPGNQWVTAAKQMASKEGIAIDLPAGPSEVMIVADKTANPLFVAADMLSQAEHGGDSQAVLVTSDAALARQVVSELETELSRLSRRDTILEALRHSAIVITGSDDDTVSIMNGYAPEHLILSVADPDGIAAMVVNAGSVFLGNYTPESAGDYASGTNHTLPTNGAARAWSGVNTDSFMKKITFQNISLKGLRSIGPVIEVMAHAEQLDAHARAVRVRLEERGGDA